MRTDLDRNVGRNSILIVCFLLIFASIAILISGGMSYNVDGLDTPQGYTTLDEIAINDPSSIQKTQSGFTVLKDISVPSVNPLYIGPGNRIVIKKGISLEFRGSTRVEGTNSDPVVFEPDEGVDQWEGITLIGTNPDDRAILRNVSVSGGKVGLRIRSLGVYGSDIRTLSSETAGLELRGPLNTLDSRLERVTIHHGGFYGISIWNTENVNLRSLSINDCTTGLRSYGSGLNIDGMFINNSSGNGMQIVESTLNGRSCTFLTARSVGFTTSAQISSTNSEVRLVSGRMGFSNNAILAVSGSRIFLEGNDIGPSNFQGIRSTDSELRIVDCFIHDCGGSAIESSGSKIDIRMSVFIRNGAGQGGISHPTFGIVTSAIGFENCTFGNAMSSHVDASGSSVRVFNSTWGTSVSNSFVIGDSSAISFGNTRPPSDVRYSDEGSIGRYVHFMKVRTILHDTGAPLVGALIHIRDRAGDIISSSRTGTGGMTNPLGLLVYTNNSLETRSNLPFRIYAQSTGNDISTMEMFEVTDIVEMTIYPPNSPPELLIFQPIDDSIHRASMLIRGIIRDDLGVFFIRIQFGTARAEMIAVDVVGADGNFTVEIPLINLSSGEHSLDIRAFDGVHQSNAVTRRIYVVNPLTMDSDNDGLSDYVEEFILGTDPFDPDTDGDGLLDGLEDRNGNGIVDEGETDPLNPDTDGDYLLDGFEDSNRNGRVDPWETDPLNPDSDGDGIKDGEDLNPLVPDLPVSKLSENDLWNLVLSAFVFLLIIILLYLLYIRTRDSSIGPGPNINNIVRRSNPDGRSSNDRGQVR